MPVPHIATYGYSRQDRPIQTCSLGEGPASVLVIGGVHGDETQSVPLVEDLLNDVAAFPERITDLTIHFLLQANPDGVAARTRTNANGVDINRNMGYEWSSRSRSERTNPGVSPYSEPETVAVRRAILAIKPARILSVHGFANLIDYDTDGGLALARLMAEQNGMDVRTIGYPTPGSLGRYCAHFGIPLVTLELPRDPSRETTWESQKAALWAFLRAGE